MAHTTTVTEYCNVLARSKLVPEPDVAALRKKWADETQGADADVDAFRKFLVRRKALTDYQAAMIQRGHAEGYFVGGYVILERLGRGASAGVYKAVHNSGQVVALKIMAGSRSKDPTVLQRFQREGRLVTQLDHPNVVRAFQVGQHDNIHFIVMEHLEGDTLDEVLARRKKLPPAEACRVVYHALRGLAHVLEKRMVHRDLKPSNLMVTPPSPEGGPDSTLHGTIKILDIGIGREMFDDAAPNPQDDNLTADGTILGTPDYMAPEQARDARYVDVRADIYSLGCVLYHLLAGRPPFVEKNVMSMMVKHATGTPEPLAAVCPGVPPGLQAVYDRMTAKRPDDRFGTPEEAAEALKPFLPAGAATATSAALLPAYKQYLDTETGIEIPPVLDPKKPGTGPAPAAPKPGTAPAAPVPAKAAKPAPAPVPVKPAKPKPKSRDDDEVEEIGVELVTLPPTAPLPAADAEPGEPEEPRSLFDLNRRDFLMLGFGAGGVLLAIGAGYGLAKALKQATAENPEPK